MMVMNVTFQRGQGGYHAYGYRWAATGKVGQS
jgi:hypothetical protein